ncbi:MAG: M13 family peptidase, partial [Sphingomonas sp.]|nr:M13 family peptidase [Sphingomonas sp.]
MTLASACMLAIAPMVADAAPPVFGTWGYNPAAMNRSVKPGDDFFAYVNGSWYSHTDIAPDRTFVGIDSVLNDQIDKDVRSVVEDSARDPSASGHIGQQIGDLYASWMDQPAIEARGLAPARPYLDRIAAVQTRAQLAALWGTPAYPSPLPAF